MMMSGTASNGKETLDFLELLPFSRRERTLGCDVNGWKGNLAVSAVRLPETIVIPYNSLK